MTRVVIIGNAGGGKSVLGQWLSRARGLPYVALDLIQWLPGWSLLPEDEFEARHDTLLARDAWIIDGVGPWQAIERRLDRADTIVFVNLPLWLHYWWATKRQLASLIRERPGGLPDASGDGVSTG